MTLEGMLTEPPGLLQHSSEPPPDPQPRPVPVGQPASESSANNNVPITSKRTWCSQPRKLCLLY